MTDTPLARLDRMLANAPHGANAARLLQNLVVFQGAFGRSAVTFMTPEDMSEADSIKAFATLRNWCLVQQVTRRRYLIDETIKQHFPPSPDLQAEMFDYFSGFGGVSDLAWVYFYWRDFAAALLWGLGHRPIEVRELGRTLRPYVRPPADRTMEQVWSAYLEAIRMLALRVQGGSQPFAPALRGDVPLSDENFTPDDWYEQSLELYFQMNGPNDQATLLTLRGLTARQNDDLPLARHFYQQALAIYHTLGNRFKQIEMSRTLFDIAIEERNLEMAQADLERHLGLVATAQQASSLYRLGQLAHAMKNAPVARDAFARSLSLLNPRAAEMMTRILGDWSHMEYELGDHTEARALYHQAMSAYRQDIEIALGFDAGTRQKGQLAKLQALVAMMDGDDV